MFHKISERCRVCALLRRGDLNPAKCASSMGVKQTTFYEPVKICSPLISVQDGGGSRSTLRNLPTFGLCINTQISGQTTPIGNIVVGRSKTPLTHLLQVRISRYPCGVCQFVFLKVEGKGIFSEYSGFKCTTITTCCIGKSEGVLTVRKCFQKALDNNNNNNEKTFKGTRFVTKR